MEIAENLPTGLAATAHLTGLLGRPFLAAGTEAGRVVDLGALPGADEWPIVAVRVRRRRHERVLLDPVVERGRLRAVADDRAPRPDLVWLRADLLDHRVIDVDGRRVVRVGDLTLEQAGQRLAAIGVELGWEPLVRRLGLRRLARHVQPALLPLSALHVPGATAGVLELATTAARLAALESRDLAGLLSRLSLAEAGDVMAALPPQAAAAAVDALHPEHAVDVLARAPSPVAARIVDELPTGHRVPLLHRRGRPPRRFDRRLSARGHRHL
jgi:hypothetical protein